MGISRYVAVGKDEQSLRRLCEHLPQGFVFVTTPALLQAQIEPMENTFFLIDDRAPAECLKMLASCPHQLWLMSPGSSVKPSGPVLKKPLSLQELQNLVARQEPVAVITLSPACRFSPEGRLLGQKQVNLTERETHLLQYLADHRGNVISKEELFRNIWGFSADLDTHTLETHIYRLRGKLEEAGENPALIETAGGGYRLS